MEATLPEKPLREGVTPDKKLLAVASLFGISFSVLMTKQHIGLNFFILVLLIYAAGIATLGAGSGKRFKENAYAYLFTVPVVLLSMTFLLFSNSFAPLNMLIVLVLVWAQFLLFTGKNAHDWFDIRFGVDFVLSFALRLCGCIHRYFQHAFGFLFAKTGKKNAPAVKVVIGVAAGLGLLLVILPLLISADENMRAELDFLFKNIDLGDAFLYIFFFLLASSLSFGFIWSLQGDKPGIYTAKLKPIEKKPFPALCIVSAFTVVAVVYVFFAALQFKYLFSNYSTLMSTPNLTNSQYAVRGFAELMLITFINFGLLALAMKFTHSEGKGKTVYLKILYLLLIAFNFIILLSSHLRLSLYEYSFGFTAARFLPHIFLILIAALNVVMLIKIFKAELRALKYMLLLFLIFYTAINFIGVDALVAKLNIERFYTRNQQASAIDEEYLLKLSDDALPVVADFLEEQRANPHIFKVYEEDGDKNAGFEDGGALSPEEYLNEDFPDLSKMITKSGGKIYVSGRSVGSKIERYKNINTKWQSFNLSRQNAQAAWERINEILLAKEPVLREKGK